MTRQIRVAIGIHAYCTNDPTSDSVRNVSLHTLKHNRCCTATNIATSVTCDAHFTRSTSSTSETRNAHPRSNMCIERWCQTVFGISGTGLAGQARSLLLKSTDLWTLSRYIDGAHSWRSFHKTDDATSTVTATRANFNPAALALN